MVLAAICNESDKPDDARTMVLLLDHFTRALDKALLPQVASECWNRGVAFSLAMEHARRIVAGSDPILTGQLVK